MLLPCLGSVGLWFFLLQTILGVCCAVICSFYFVNEVIVVLVYLCTRQCSLFSIFFLTQLPLSSLDDIFLTTLSLGIKDADHFSIFLSSLLYLQIVHFFSPDFGVCGVCQQLGKLVKGD